VRSSLPGTLAAVDDDRLPVSVAARRLLAAFAADGATSAAGNGDPGVGRHD
jgi:hypothetical protein